MCVTVNILVDPQTLERTRFGTVVGALCLSGPGWYFPDQYWSDFPVVVLSWWLTACQGVASRVGSTGTFLFMDGPHTVRISSLTEVEWRLECIDGVGRVTHDASVSARHLRAAVEDASRTIVAACGARSWESQDITTLRAVSRA